LPATAIFAEHSNYSHVIDKFAQVPGNVGRASRVERFSSHLHDWDRRLRRDTADLSPDKFVEHQIAYNGDSPRSRALKDVLQPVQFHGDARLGRWRLKSLADLRLEGMNGIGAGISCVQREFRLRFAPLNPEYESEINSRKYQ
jgi:hypothetical protein